MRAHQADLRAEVEQEHARISAPGGAAEAPLEAEARAALANPAAFAADIAAQGSEAAPTARLRALLQFAERLAIAPGGMDEQALQPLREAGLDDRAIHDAAQAIAYFSYINRVADGLGVDLEPEME